MRYSCGCGSLSPAWVHLYCAEAKYFVACVRVGTRCASVLMGSTLGWPTSCARSTARIFCCSTTHRPRKTPRALHRSILCAHDRKYCHFLHTCRSALCRLVRPVACPGLATMPTVREL
eukprot:6204977-Pleurochrysis_carterae.AAC.2